MVNEYSNDDRILIVENFDEIQQPYSCEQWGDFAEENLPMIFTDGTSSGDFFGAFPGELRWSNIVTWRNGSISFYQVTFRSVRGI